MTSDIAVLDGAGSGAIRTARLQLLEMPGLLVSAILQKNWPAAEHLLGTPFRVSGATTAGVGSSRN
jgi:hypothetical protein